MDLYSHYPPGTNTGQENYLIYKRYNPKFNFNLKNNLFQVLNRR